MRRTIHAGLATLALMLVAAAPQPSAPSPGDAEALAFAVVVDSGEMMLADLAINKKVSSGVMNYVTDLKEGHQEHLKALMSEAGKENVMYARTGLADSLHKKAMDTHQKLMDKSGTDFEKEFLTAMIDGHNEAMQTLDSKIMNTELSSGVKKEMDHLKRMIEEHLGKAKALRDG